MTGSKILGWRLERRCSLALNRLRMRPLWPRRQALSKCLRSLVMWLRRSLELNAATRVVLSVAPIGTRVVLSVVSIAMSVERYADTATESITRSRILLAAKSKRTPRLRIQGRGVLLASVIRPSLSKTDDFNRICRRAELTRGWSGPRRPDKDQAADLTVCRVYWSSNCCGLR